MTHCISLINHNSHHSPPNTQCSEAIPAGARPYRSTHLDTVVAIVAEALPAQERGEWEKREAATQAYYEKHGGERGVCYGEKGEEAGDKGEGEEVGAGAAGAGASAISPSQKPVAGVGAGKWKKGEAMCEGCNGRGHDYEDCPHRKDRGYGGEEEEEEEDGGGYGEEDEEDEEEGEEEDDDDDNSSGRVGW